MKVRILGVKERREVRKCLSRNMTSSWGWLNLRTENLDHIYENTMSKEEKAEDTRWRADTDKFMGGR